MASITEIRKFVSDYLDRNITGKEFADQVVRALYALSPDADKDLHKFIHGLNARVAEVHLGLISDFEFRTSLQPYSNGTPSINKAEYVSLPSAYHLEELELV